MIITENGYDQYETHCSFDSIDERGAGAWTVAGECSVQGDQQALAMHMSVANDTLTLSENGQPFAELQRCS